MPLKSFGNKCYEVIDVICFLTGVTQHRSGALCEGWSRYQMLKLVVYQRSQGLLRKNQLKRRMEDTLPPVLSSFTCAYPGHAFFGQTKADMIYHSQQIHSSWAQSQLECPHYGCSFCKQGITMHNRLCLSNLDKPKLVNRQCTHKEGICVACTIFL